MFVWKDENKQKEAGNHTFKKENIKVLSVPPLKFPQCDSSIMPLFLFTALN